jgi:hypothetical protein
VTEKGSGVWTLHPHPDQRKLLVHLHCPLASASVARPRSALATRTVSWTRGAGIYEYNLFAQEPAAEPNGG